MLDFVLVVGTEQILRDMCRVKTSHLLVQEKNKVLLHKVLQMCKPPSPVRTVHFMLKFEDELQNSGQ